MSDKSVLGLSELMEVHQLVDVVCDGCDPGCLKQQGAFIGFISKEFRERLSLELRILL